MGRLKYYSLKNILAKNCDYNLIIGERSNGKTYACLKYCLEHYVKSGYVKQFAYVRRWKEDVTGRRADAVFTGIVQNNEVFKLTDGKYSDIRYYSGKYYLCNYDEESKKFIAMKDPFCYNFSLSDMEHDKSTSYPNIDNIIFDEFITRKYYLNDEFVLFMNVVSTIVRDRNINKIFLCGNTVNKYNPYFENFGIKNEIEQGRIDCYKFGESGETTLALEYCADNTESKKKSNKYFAFNNPKLQMITGGKWELDIYPHLQADQKIRESDIVFSFVVVFDGKMYQGDVIENGEESFIYFHNKTTPIKPKTLVYQLQYSTSPYVRNNLMYVNDKITRKIVSYFASGKVFYQSNEIGESIHNFVVNCQKH